MRVLVMTVVHHPEDARILHREIASLTAAGHSVVYAAPFSARGVTPRDGLEGVDLPRSAGRNRLGAVKAARAAYRRLRDEVDITVLHDPELLLAVAGAHRGRPVVWDVHEDTAAALGMKAWLPRPARVPLAAAVRLAESAAERSVHLLLAEHGYVGRFRRPHPVVPNQTLVPAQVPPPGADRAVYLGAITLERGAAEMVAVARRLAPEGVRVELIGGADAAATPLLEQAVADGVLDWAGFQPNDTALARLPGALTGLSLLTDQPNYRHSMPTKVIEYMAHGLPVVTTPNPPAADLVTRHGCGTVVGWDDPAAAAAAVLRLRDDAERRVAYGRRGHEAALAEHDWRTAGEKFVAQLEAWARAGS
ncbi:glycosyltransferase [Sporichthya polymorpha]|uniref:glycosyltransferase n=1 Tax=Sporichthya polymorpha TaxID=35751 RepID=UPI000371B6CB|nr:glycosyltransferase [Sporichthya polymorpha]